MGKTKQLFSPRYDAVIANAAIDEGQAVKLVSDERTVGAVDSADDTVIGFARFAADAAQETIEIYREGGDAVGLAGGTIGFGDPVAVNGSGALVVSDGHNAKCIGFAIEAASSGDFVRFLFTRFNGMVNTYTASGAVAANRAVALDTNASTVAQVTAADDIVHGIAKHAAADTATVEIYREGEDAMAEAASAITFGSAVKVTANGRIEAGSANDKCIGYATQAASAAGDIIQIVFDKFTA